MDGEREINLNYKTEFLAAGTAVYYAAAGNQSTRGTYVVEGGTIIYTDEKGEQKWKLVSMNENSLHVDHRGAEMFFKRP